MRKKLFLHQVFTLFLALVLIMGGSGLSSYANVATEEIKQLDVVETIEQVELVKEKGEIEGYILRNGSLVGPKAGIIETEDINSMIEIPIYTVLLKHPEGTVLFDAAAHKDEGRQDEFILNALKMEPEDDLLNRLAQIDVSPEDIDYVVISHLHADHSGYIEKFPNSKVIVSEDEFTNTVRDYALGTSRSARDVEYWIKQDINWVLLPSDQESMELLDGITIYNFGEGHSYGMLGLLVEFLEAGNVIIAGDAINLEENIDIIPKIGSALNRKEAKRTLFDIIQLANDKNAEIWYGHDIDGLIDSTKGFYK